MKRALLIGINRYPGAPLRGCVNDVHNMANLLMTRYGFAASDIVILTDGDATTANILAKLNWLVSVTPDFELFFHYSGHGATTPSGRPDKPNGVSECICPVDFDWSRQHMIIDSQLVEIFSRIPSGCIFNWVSDSCHSGTLDRDMPAPEPWYKRLWNHFFPPCCDKRAFPVPLAMQAVISAARAMGHAPKGMTNGILDVGYVAGCRSDQTSADTQDPNGVPCGALTYYLVKKIQQTQPMPLKDLVAMVSQDLANDGYDQRPQAEGARIDKPFLT